MVYKGKNLRGKDKSVTVSRKGTTKRIEQFERRKKVHNLMCMGFKNWEIAEQCDVVERTIDRDLKWLFAEVDIDEEKKRMREQLEWSLKQASINYLKSTEKKDKAMFLHLYNQINRTKAIYMKNFNINIQNIINPKLSYEDVRRVIHKQIEKEQTPEKEIITAEYKTEKENQSTS